MSVPSLPSSFDPQQLARAKVIGQVHRDAATIVIAESVLEEMIEFSEEDCQRERGGFLLGDVYDVPTPLIVIRYFHAAREARSAATTLTFTHDSWSTLHREASQRYPEAIVLGWQHTHPGLGVFLSGYDLFIHRNFFPQPWQVALVIDPNRQELGFFQWRGSEVQDCGFLCLHE